jgi:hypothetical protein
MFLTFNMNLRYAPFGATGVSGVAVSDSSVSAHGPTPDTLGAGDVDAGLLVDGDWVPPTIGVSTDAVTVGDGSGGVEVVEPARFVPASELDGDPEHDVQSMITATIKTPSTTTRRRQ